MPPKKRDMVMAAVTRRYIEVPMDDLIPGLPFIRLQSLTAGELNKVREPRLTAVGINALKIAFANEARRMVVATALEDDNSQMFTLEDVIALESKDAAIIERLSNAAEAHVTPTRAVEDIEKNSERTGEPS